MGLFGKMFGSGEENELKRKNFPPCYPIMYHSISECGEKKYLAIMGLGQWILFLIILLANAVGCNISLFTGISHGDWWQRTLGSAIISLIWVVILPLLTFITSYLVTYYACASGFLPHYIVFFFCRTIDVIFCLVMASGVPNSGGAGLLMGIATSVQAKNNGAFVVALIYNFVMFAVWIGNALLIMVMMALMGKHMFSSKISVKGAMRGVARRALT
mmetsp:Transcript_6080/g.8849  ORF Transcript_6080/g.8849 Transcript_6080/m.8849 type:complete len:216 (-) Transcript_6080:48-695(-)